MTIEWNWVKMKRNTSLQAYCDRKKAKDYESLCEELLSDQITPPDKDSEEVVNLRYWSDSTSASSDVGEASSVQTTSTRARRSRRKRSDG